MVEEDLSPRSNASPLATNSGNQRMHPVVAVLSGVGCFGFLAWLCWIITKLVASGVPEADRAGLIGTLVMAASGVVVTSIAAARGLDQNPLGGLGSIVGGLRNMVRRY
jgi:hypothetical protein